MGRSQNGELEGLRLHPNLEQTTKGLKSPVTARGKLQTQTAAGKRVDLSVGIKVAVESKWEKTFPEKEASRDDGISEAGRELEVPTGEVRFYGQIKMRAVQEHLLLLLCLLLFLLLLLRLRPKFKQSPRRSREEKDEKMRVTREGDEVGGRGASSDLCVPSLSLLSMRDPSNTITV